MMPKATKNGQVHSHPRCLIHNEIVLSLKRCIKHVYGQVDEQTLNTLGLETRREGEREIYIYNVFELGLFQ